MAPKSRGGGGNISRRAAIALIGGGGLVGISSTGAFSQVDNSRGFGVSTATDANAQLRIVGLEEGGKYEEGREFRITNRLSEPLTDNRVSSKNGDLIIEPVGNQDSTLDVGETDKFKITTSGETSGETGSYEVLFPNGGSPCLSTGQGEISDTITIQYSGAGTTVDLSRQISISSTSNDPGDCPAAGKVITGQLKDDLIYDGTVKIEGNGKDKGQVKGVKVDVTGCIILDDSAIVNPNSKLIANNSVVLRGSAKILNSEVIAGNDVRLESPDTKINNSNVTYGGSLSNEAGGTLNNVDEYTLDECSSSG